MNHPLETVDLAETNLPDFVGADEEQIRGFLACHVRVESSVPVAYFLDRSPGLRAVPVSVGVKAELELNTWIRAFDSKPTHSELSSPRDLERVGLQDQSKDARNRAYRLLTALKTLCFRHCHLVKPVVGWREDDPYRVLLNWDDDSSLVCQRIPVSDDWHLSTALLLLRATAWAQSEWGLRSLWEGYSSVRARQDHERNRWLNSDGIRRLAYLVRFQSAPGQFCRRSGDTRFVDIASQQWPDSTSTTMLELLGILGSAQEFRAGFERQASDPRPFTDYWESIRASGDPDLPASHAARPKVTWAYAAFLSRKPLLSPAQLTAFKELVYEVVSPEGGPSAHAEGDTLTPAESSQTAPVLYAFDREFSYEDDLQKILASQIRAALASKSLSDYFATHDVQVPHWAGPSNLHERVVVVRLRQHLMAAHMSFPGIASLDSGIESLDAGIRASLASLQARQEVPAELKPDAFTAWQLLLFLCSLGGHLSKETIRGHTAEFVTSAYSPTQLMARFLHICFRLRPQDCHAVSVRINGGTPAFVHLPRRDGNTTAWVEKVKTQTARYVWTYVLNKVMCHDVHSCDVGLSDLESTNDGIEWFKSIMTEYRANAYDVLLGKYLNDFRFDGNRIRSRAEEVRSDVLPGDERMASDPLGELCRLRNCIGIGSEQAPDIYIAGVDVGGQFIKTQLYRLQFEGKKALFKDVKDHNNVRLQSRIRTRLPGEKQYDNPEEFCSRVRAEIDWLVKRAQEYATSQNLPDVALCAIGVSWPGPVRDGRIQGTSGTLQMFKGFEREIKLNQIEEVRQIDITSGLRKGRTLPVRATSSDRAEPVAFPVTILNDGDSHAWGALTDQLERQRTHRARRTGAPWLVLKAGTGTAGALVSGSGLAPGLIEFGKLIVNLAYTPSEKYPEGLANAVCSAKTLPDLAKKELAGLAKRQPDVASIEIGILAELHNAPRASWGEILVRLRRECGAIAIAESLPEQVDASEVKTLVNAHGWRTRDVSRREVEGALNLLGDDAYRELIRRVKVHGMIRIAKILDLSTSETTQLGQYLAPFEAEGCDEPHLDALAASTVAVPQRVRTAASDCKKCALVFGDRIGDILALLVGEYPEARRVLLAGGVFADATGGFVMKRAQARLQDYGLRSIHLRKERPDGRDSGTLGAAARGALELLRSLHWAGFARIRRLVTTLELNQSIVATATEVTGPGGERVLLGHWALERRDVLDYLRQLSSELGLVETVNDGKHTEFLRFIRK